MSHAETHEQNIGECPCEYALRYIGGAWKILIVVILDRAKIRRHAELSRVLRGITPKMLTQQLREMEQDGLITRAVYPEVPPRVEYELTPFGETLRPVIEAMWTWGKQARESDAQGLPTMSAMGMLRELQFFQEFYRCVWAYLLFPTMNL